MYIHPIVTYVRVSGESQVKGDSIEFQISFCKEVARREEKALYLPAERRRIRCLKYEENPSCFIIVVRNWGRSL
jgi:hypothetical protein